MNNRPIAAPAHRHPLQPPAGRIQPIGGLRSAPSSQVGPPRGENSTHRATPESRKTGDETVGRGDQHDPIFTNGSSEPHFSPGVEVSSSEIISLWGDGRQSSDEDCWRMLIGLNFLHGSSNHNNSEDESRESAMPRQDWKKTYEGQLQHGMGNWVGCGVG